MTSNISVTPTLIKELNETTISFKTLEELITKFISDIDEQYKPDYAFLGLPGPIEDNCIITLPNIPQWGSSNGTELGKKLGLKKLIFINDFVGDGYAIQTNLVEKKDYIVVENTIYSEKGLNLNENIGDDELLIKEDSLLVYIVEAVDIFLSVQLVIFL